MSNFATRLHEAVREKGTPTLVGIDPRYELLPEPVILSAGMRRAQDELTRRAAAFEEFSKRLIDVVAPLVPAVKPQSAFFEELGPAGVQVLRQTIRYARKAGLLVILDAKRGDIGSTATAYANALLSGSDPEAAPFGADAVTVNPYLGDDTLEPFVSRARQVGGGVYVLIRTSNPGSGFLQDSTRDGRPLTDVLAEHLNEQAKAAAEPGETYGPVGAVVGATYPEELRHLREKMPSCPLLVPGYGSQGGGAEDVASAFDPDGLGALINSSRGINFAYRREEYADEYGPERWEEATEAATRAMIDDLGELAGPGNLCRSGNDPN